MDDTPAEIALTGGNVGGAVRVGDTVRRPAGPWTPAVHDLLGFLERAGLDGVPRVHGFDEQGREVLDFLPGRSYQPDRESPSDEVLAAAMRWLGRYHRVVAAYRPAGVVRWRNSSEELGDDRIVCMHDFGSYNWTVSPGGEFTGVIDWDMAGPGVPLDDVAFAAWSAVPLAEPAEPRRVAARLSLMAASYGGLTAEQILYAVPDRLLRSVRVIRAGQQAGDPGMLRLGTVGEPERTEHRLADLDRRTRDIAAHL